MPLRSFRVGSLTPLAVNMASAICCTVALSGPHYVDGGTEQGAPFKPGIAGDPAPRRYRPGIVLRIEHLNDGLDGDHISGQAVSLLLVLKDATADVRM